MSKKAIIIGAGPAGLTAAYELLTRTDIIPVILEKSGDIGGISKTVNYKGNRMDIGGHRFFSKSDRVMKWWLQILPLAESADKNFTIQYQNKSTEIINDRNGNRHPQDADKVMLVRKRLSRIYFLRQFFTYPISLSIDTLRKLGVGRTFAILVSYLKAQLFPRKPENSLADFMINRFGKTLYELFFRDYTEKVWGVPCQEIPAEWGAQRIKGVSISKAIAHAVKEVTRKKQKTSGDISQKDTETSLIEQFLYPKLGPGQLWEEVARQVQEMGAVIHMHYNVEKIYTTDGGVTGLAAVNNQTGASLYLEGDYFFSTMPVKELIADIEGPVPVKVQEVAAGLQYRDFITVGILLNRMAAKDPATGEWKRLDLKDNWIYIQDTGVKVGRLQIFNNWSPYMVANPDTVWVGMEFFCNDTDDFWKLPDEQIKAIAIKELEMIGLIAASDVLDSTVLRVEKTYPAYFGAYEQFDVVREYTDSLRNLFLVGRNGMHKYNNADHSMLTAMVAVDNIAGGVEGKENIWAINTEQEYHEEKGEGDKTMPEKITASK
jgi:protoporphyrinogen oxidase